MGEEFEENLQTFLRRQPFVEITVSFFRFLEAAEFRDRLLHAQLYHASQSFRVK